MIEQDTSHSKGGTRTTKASAWAIDCEHPM